MAKMLDWLECWFCKSKVARFALISAISISFGFFRTTTTTNLFLTQNTHMIINERHSIKIIQQRDAVDGPNSKYVWQQEILHEELGSSIAQLVRMPS